MTLGERIKSLRDKNGWTQTYFGEKLNLTKASISGYENDTRSPDKETLIKIANLFNVSTDYLLGNKTEEKEPYSKKQQTLAAHIDDDISEEQMEDILEYIEFIKQKHKKE